MTPNQSFIICTQPRSGSTYLCEGLAGLRIAGNPREWFAPPQFRADETDAQYIQRILSHGSSPNGVFGAKLHLDQIAGAKQKLRGYLQDPASRFDVLLQQTFPRLSYVWLQRRDKVAQAISLHRALHTGEFSRALDEPPATTVRPSRHPLAFDDEALYRHVDILTSGDAVWGEIFRTCSIQPFIVVYEDLIASYEATLQRILLHLGMSAPAEFPEPQMQRQADTLSKVWHSRFTAAHPAVEAEPIDVLRPWVDALLQ